jgi:release factor glutamine methyltransferase
MASGPRWRALVDEAVGRGIPGAEVRRIVEHVTGVDDGAAVTVLDDEAPERQADRFDALVARRSAGEPLQYVLGSWGFRGLDLLVDRRVLIPRPETEWVVEQALGLLPAGSDAGSQVVVDLGTGSGAIALSIAQERFPHVRVVATDVSDDALDVARANLAGLGRRAAAVELHLGSWWDAVPPELRGGLDLVVSNPPYIGADEALPPEVADWEPRGALVPGDAGTEDLEVILAGAADWLRPGSWVVCEIGEAQGAAVAAIAAAAGLVDVAVRPDLSGRDRMVVARRP